MKRLLQEALDVLECYDNGSFGQDRCVMDRLRAAIDAPEQEPVMWAFKYTNGLFYDASHTQHSHGMRPLYAKPQPVSDLTDEEIVKIAIASSGAEPGRDGYILPVTFARAVLAAQKEKQ